MSEAGLLAVGTNVDIQRTDGRIHTAVISSLNEATKTVTVEWYEKGESKGKEIDFQTIFKLNSDYAPKNSSNNSNSNNVIHDNNGHNETKYVPQLQKESRSTVGFNKQQSNDIQTKIPSTKVPTSSRANVSISRIPQMGTPQYIEDDERTETEATENIFNDKKGKTTNRKSNCVKEIEKINQKREERRAAQKAYKDQPDYDTSNPNYDFLMMIKEYQSKLDYCPLSNTEPIEYHQICVCVRKRPLNKKELGRREIDVVTVPNKQGITVHEPKLKVDLTKYLENQNFRFDYAFDDTVDNKTVYRYTAKPLVECIFEKGMATCFAYGQTGSGKTHTMGGEFQGQGLQNHSGGIYALAATDVFHLLSTKYKSEDLIVQSAFFEIYGGKVFDLLNKKEKLRILEDHKGQVQIVGLKLMDVNGVSDVQTLLQTGNKCRTSGQTSANQHSSRSHAVFQIILKKRLTNRLHGKFSLIDLAGNERGADTSSSDRNTRMEGAEINKSLLALKECIRALGRKGAHTPFRASKLTQVLRDSFIGANSRTCMISMISPGMQSCEHTLNTLRYADRVKELGGAAPSTAPNNAGNDQVNISSGQVCGSGDHENRAQQQQPYSNHKSAASSSNNKAYNNNKVQNNAAVNSNGKRYAEPQQSPDQQDQEFNMEEEYDDEIDDDYAANMQDNDMAMLRSANADLIDEDMFNFQELVNEIEELEETVCDKHKDIVQEMPNYQKEHTALFNMTKQVDYPLDEYANKLGDLLDKQLKEITEFRATVQDLRDALKKEEEISNSLLANRGNH